MNKIIISLLFTLLITSSCKKEEEKPPTGSGSHTTYMHIHAGLDQFRFQSGSYWVYENDTTGALDSVVLTSTSTGWIITSPSVHGGPSTQAEIYKMFMHGFGTGLDYNHSLLGKSMYYNFTGTSIVSGLHAQPIYLTDCTVGTISTGMEVLDQELTVSIGSNTFNSVDKMKVSFADQDPPAEFACDTYFYYADTLGLIKKESDLGSGNIESWSLIRWHVIH